MFYFNFLRLLFCIKLKSNISVGICTAIFTFFYCKAYCICFFNPLCSTKHKAWQTCLHFKVVKFDHFKIGVIYLFPSAQILQSVPVS